MLSFSNPLTSMIRNPTIILNVLVFSILSLFFFLFASWNYGFYSLYIYGLSDTLCSPTFLHLRYDWTVFIIVGYVEC